MSRYRRASMCRYCYGTGHTKRTCPKVKADAANGNAWAKDMLDQAKQIVANRVCSYCGEQKHTTRTCSKKFNDGATFEKVNCEYRNFVKKDLTRQSYEIGALVKYTPYRYDSVNQPVICYVEKINVDNSRPPNNWFIKEKCKLHDAQNDIERDQYHTYLNRSKDKGAKKRNVGCTIVVRSVSGTGLGYWGENESDVIDCDEFLHDYSTYRNRYQVVS